MSLFDQINSEYIEAYKGKNSIKVAVLRHVKTAAKNRLVETKRPNDTPDDDEMLEILKKQAKQRQESIEQFTKANRKDLADREAAELEVLKTYLPKLMSQEELETLVRETITAENAQGPQDMGKIMGRIMGTHKNRVDGKTLSETVKRLLASL